MTGSGRGKRDAENVRQPVSPDEERPEGPRPLRTHRDLRRIVAAGYAALLVVLATIAWAGFREGRAARAAARVDRDEYLVTGQLAALRLEVSGLESPLRVYLASSDRTAMSRYRGAHMRVVRQLDTLETQLQGTDHMAAVVATLRGRLAELDRLIGTMATGRPGRVDSVAAIARFAAAVAAVDSSIRGTLKRDEADAISRIERSSTLVLGGLVLAMAGLAVAGGAVLRDLRVLDESNGRQQTLVLSLQAALAEVRTLRGLLPICASCKQVLDDQGTWQQIEAYVTAHTDAEFTHSMCPACTRRLYPGLDVGS